MMKCVASASASNIQYSVIFKKLVYDGYETALNIVTINEEKSLSRCGRLGVRITCGSGIAQIVPTTPAALHRGRGI